MLYRFAYTLLRIYWYVFRPAAVGVQCVISCERHLLLIRNTYGRQSWTFPGGGLKLGETPETAVCREVYEEVGIKLGAVQLLGTFRGRQDCRHDIVHVFAAQAASQACTIDPGEILEARWFVAEMLPPLSGYALQVFNFWQQHEDEKLASGPFY
jgi:ADP-ribose pyrophosphatase YjhB (NUDIX family)